MAHLLDKIFHQIHSQQNWDPSDSILLMLGAADGPQCAFRCSFGAKQKISASQKGISILCLAPSDLV
jgi:hypothetical protein